MKLLAVLAMFAVLYGCAEARAVNRLRVELWQDADSARYAISWVAGPQGNRQRATSFYELEILSAAAVVASDTTSGLTDTLAVAYPPLDSVMPLLARVRAVDIDGAPSEWAESTPFTLVTPKLPPSPPADVTADTLAIVTEIVFRPTYVSLVFGDPVRYCTIYLLSDGRTGLTTNSQPFTRCAELYDRWLTERSA